MEFQEALAKYFRLWRGNIARSRLDKPNPRGRWSLAYIMADMGFREGVEIGTRYGDSAKIWCSVNSQLHLTCIDPYLAYEPFPKQDNQEEAYATACKILAPYKATVLRAKSLERVGDFADASLDFVHIDGDHDFDPCMADLIAWAPKVRKGGLILVHDYLSLHWQHVALAVDTYIRAHRVRSWYATHDPSITAFWVKT